MTDEERKVVNAADLIVVRRVEAALVAATKVAAAQVGLVKGPAVGTVGFTLTRLTEEIRTLRFLIDDLEKSLVALA